MDRSRLDSKSPIPRSSAAGLLSYDRNFFIYKFASGYRLGIAHTIRKIHIAVSLNDKWDSVRNFPIFIRNITYLRSRP